jgi:hypothetical protein
VGITALKCSGFLKKGSVKYLEDILIARVPSNIEKALGETI